MKGMAAQREPEGGVADERRRFGIEEEYLLLDETSGRPVDRAAELVRSASALGEKAEREFLSSQVESSTPVCRTAVEAEAALDAFRSAVSSAAVDHGLVLAGTGLPPVGGDTAGTVTPRPRYLAIEAGVRDVGAHQFSTGLHVHVEVPSRDAGVDALARLPRWAPALLAMTANSPFWCGSPTGFASWRHIKGLAWPLGGYPPSFADGDDYTRTIETLVGSGVLIDSGMTTWVARLSENYPTLELRIADAQLEARDSVAFAVLVRALVDRCLSKAAEGVPAPRFAPGLVNGAIWMAARDGMSASVIDPLTAEPLPAFGMVETMICTVGPELERFGDLDRVERYVDRLRREGSPAQRQLERFAENGVSGLIGLYRSGSASVPGADMASAADPM